MALAQLKAIYGEGGPDVTRWSDLGVAVPGCGTDEIVLVSRQNNSGTYVYFKEAVLGDDTEYKLGSRDMHGSKDVVELVENTPCAIGYSGLAYATEHVRDAMHRGMEEGADCVEPTIASAVAGTYPDRTPAHDVHGGPAAGGDQGLHGLDPSPPRASASSWSAATRLTTEVECA